MKLALLPRDAADARPALVEIRPGTGGEEGGPCFAGDLLRMYQRLAEARAGPSRCSTRPAELGGVKEVVARSPGKGSFCPAEIRKRRAPGAAGAGDRKRRRIHTSAATVAVLPEA